MVLMIDYSQFHKWKGIPEVEARENMGFRLSYDFTLIPLI